MQNLANNGVAIIGLDIVFAEYDNSSPKKILKELRLIKSDKALDFDEILANTIAATPTIVGYVFALSDDGIKGEEYPKSTAIFIEKALNQINHF